MKELILKLLQRELMNQHDDTWKVIQITQYKTEEQMQEQYGKSGKTYQQLLDDANDKEQKIADAIKWINEKEE